MALSPEIHEKLTAAFDGAVSIREAASRAGVSFSTAKRYAPESFLKERSVGLPRPDLQLLTIAAIRRDGGTQTRAAMSESTIVEYVELLAKGGEFRDAPVVFQDEQWFWLGDGFHRVEAAIRAGRDEIVCEVHQGLVQDAILYSCGANATHGLRRTNADKRRAVEVMVRDERWGWSQWSDREIARRCAVCNTFVRDVRREMLSVNGQQIDPGRKVRRGDSEYVMKTQRIGKSASSNGEAVHQDSPYPAHPNDPPDVAAGRRNGTIPADVAVLVEEVGPEPVSENNGEASEASISQEQTDAEYLESLPARPHLADHVRRRFDVAAILFREITPLRLEYARKCKQLTNAAKRATNGHIDPWLSRHFWYLRSNDPSRWVTCKDCSGTGSVELIGSCPACHGEGYHV